MYIQVTKLPEIGVFFLNGQFIAILGQFTNYKNSFGEKLSNKINAFYVLKLKILLKVNQQ